MKRFTLIIALLASLTVSAAAQTVEVAKVETFSLSGRVATSGTRLHVDPDATSPYILTLKANDVVAVSGGPQSGDWLRVQIAGQTGWIKATELVILFSESVPVEQKAKEPAAVPGHDIETGEYIRPKVPDWVYIGVSNGDTVYLRGLRRSGSEYRPEISGWLKFVPKDLAAARKKLKQPKLAYTLQHLSINCRQHEIKVNSLIEFGSSGKVLRDLPTGRMAFFSPIVPGSFGELMAEIFCY